MTPTEYSTPSLIVTDGQLRARTSLTAGGDILGFFLVSASLAGDCERSITILSFKVGEVRNSVFMTTCCAIQLATQDLGLSELKWRRTFLGPAPGPSLSPSEAFQRWSDSSSYTYQL